MAYTLKCFLELQDCIREYDCISCEVAKHYWSNLDERETDLENSSQESIVNAKQLSDFIALIRGAGA